MENNKKLQAIVLRQKLDSGDIKVTFTLFDTNKGKMLKDSKYGKSYIVKSLDSELEETFAGKNLMIVPSHEDSKINKAESVTQDSLSMREVIEFFKDEEILK